MAADAASKQPALVLSRVPPDEAAQYGAAFSAICAELSKAGISATIVDSVYDMQADDAGAAFLRGITGDLAFLGWHYPRALKWTLAHLGVEVNVATRKLHCLDVRDSKPETLVATAKDTLAGGQCASASSPAGSQDLVPRWYPVVDYDRCTNCMECLDFCLFGVYGVDDKERLRVVSPDQCRPDCPACARVCPAGAIVFPKYRTNRNIAGADTDESPAARKLDLSAVFGKPQARHQAAVERDQELLKADRKPAGTDKVDELADQFEKLGL
ncbi:MAG: ferredoxin family protein [Planctomycetota bacterium]|nr:ferredoxin family protein [Planctomycetota bacterium]